MCGVFAVSGGAYVLVQKIMELSFALGVLSIVAYLYNSLFEKKKFLSFLWFSLVNTVIAWVYILLLPIVNLYLLMGRDTWYEKIIQVHYYGTFVLTGIVIILFLFTLFKKSSSVEADNKNISEANSIQSTPKKIIVWSMIICFSVWVLAGIGSFVSFFITHQRFTHSVLEKILGASLILGILSVTAYFAYSLYEKKKFVGFVVFWLINASLFLVYFALLLIGVIRWELDLLGWGGPPEWYGGPLFLHFLFTFLLSIILTILFFISLLKNKESSLINEPAIMKSEEHQATIPNYSKIIHKTSLLFMTIILIFWGIMMLYSYIEYRNSIIGSSAIGLVLDVGLRMIPVVFYVIPLYCYHKLYLKGKYLMVVHIGFGITIFSILLFSISSFFVLAPAGNSLLLNSIFWVLFLLTVLSFFVAIILFIVDKVKERKAKRAQQTISET